MSQRRARREKAVLYVLRITIFALALTGLVALTGQMVGLPMIAAWLLAIAAAYGVASIIQGRRARSTWGTLLSTAQLRPDASGPRSDGPSRPGRLPPLVGTVRGRPVRVVAERVPFWLSGVSALDASETHLTTPLPAEHRETQLRLEPRKRGERTDTRLDTAESLGERTDFEKAHHLFTPHPDLARDLFDDDLQEAVDRLGRYKELRVREGTVRLLLGGTAGPTQIADGLDLIAKMAERVASRPPSSGISSMSNTLTPSAAGATG